jgi:enterochelin esterase-like enzyme
MKINIFFPKGYSTEKKYPVLYLLHGSGGDENSWINDMQVDKKAANLIDTNIIEPLIIVMPNYDNSYGTNSSIKSCSNKENECGLYADYLSKDLVQYVDENYSTIKSRESRFIGGLSMGGFAALEIAFNHSELYSKVGGHSPAMFLDATSDLKWLYSDETMRKTTDPIYLAKEKDLSHLKIYLDYADNDMGHIIDSSQILNEILKGKDAKVEIHTSAGMHDANYWRGNTESYLKFYAGKK